MGATATAKRGTNGVILGARLERSGPTGIQRQLYSLLRDLILNGQLSGGTRLPSTRVVAAEFGISRNTAIAAFEQLQAEGYVSGRIGSGTRVCSILPEHLLRASASGTVLAAPVPAGPGVSQRGRLVEAISGVGSGMIPAFSPGLPAVDRFPVQAWSKLLAEECRNPGLAATKSDAGGYWPLREQITEYVSTARGMSCEADQVIIVSGNREGTELAARVLLDPGDRAIVEDPGYPGTRSALAASSVQAIPLAVDGDGLVLADLTAAHQGARMVCVAPSHQYPLGTTTSLPRRLELLDWCRRNACWVVEDDYDSEFRYADRPLPSLQSLAPDAGVIYVGTFSKTLLPSLRVGYLIVPKPLVQPFVAMKLATSGPAALLAQQAISRFIETGMFYRHIRTMRKLYAGRRAALAELISRHMPELVIPAQEAAGLFMLTLLRDDLARKAVDVEISVLAKKAGIHVEPLSRLYMTDQVRAGLIFGFGGLREGAMAPPIQRLARLVRTSLAPRVPGTRHRTGSEAVLIPSSV